MNSLLRTVHLTKRWGEDISNPTPQDLAVAIAELAQPDSEHPDCWLSSEDGWSVSLFESGLAVLENIETDEGPWYLTDVSRETALELWSLLQAGDLPTLRAKAWQSGYGAPQK
jgi:hypothetical protein